MRDPVRGAAWLAAVAFLFAATSVAQPPATAASRTVAFANDRAGNVQHGPVRNSTSNNWAGYAATGAVFTSVSASWVQPTATCTSTATSSSFWVGIDGYANNTVEQTGTSAWCNNGSPSYFAWYEMYPHAPVTFSDTVKPGDQFSASITTNGSGVFTLTLSNATQGWSHAVTQTLNRARLASAEVIAENAGSGYPLTIFGTVSFTSATVNGKPIGTFNPDNITMVSNGVVKATTSPLTGGNAFSVTWQHG